MNHHFCSLLYKARKRFEIGEANLLTSSKNGVIIFLSLGLGKRKQENYRFLL